MRFLKNVFFIYIVFLSTHLVADSQYSGFVSLRNNGLSSDVGDVDGNRTLTNLNFNYINRNLMDKEPNRVLTFQSEVNDQDLLMFSVKEAYANFGSESTRLTIGRKILPWSVVDATWGFGKLNNRQNFNGFDPGQEGLTGLNLKKRLGSWTFEAFASYLYIPEMNPSLDINKTDRSITSRSPWVKPPNSSSDVAGIDTIYYDVNYPEISDIVFRYSVGLSINKTFLEEKLSTRAFWMKKPENNISIAADTGLETSGSTNVITAEIDPRVYYHDVIGLNATYAFTDYLKAYVGGLGVYPESFPDRDQDSFDFLGIEEEKINEQYAGGGIVYGDYKTSFGLHYIARISSFELGGSILSTAPRWNQAVNARLEFSPMKKLRALLDFKYDMLSFDRLAMLSADYRFSKQFFLGGGVQFVGAPRNKGTYWSDFRNNDSLYTQLKYTF